MSNQLRYTGALYFASSLGLFYSSTLLLRRINGANAIRRLSGPPTAKKVPESIYFGVNPRKPQEFRGKNAMDPPIVRNDVYNWLRDETRKDPVVLAHLNAENEYCAALTAPLKGLQESLYDDMLSHLKETDEEVPYRHGDYFYYSRTMKGLSYKIHCRKPAHTAGATTMSIAEEKAGVETIVLDENKIAEGHEYSDVHDHVPSPSHTRIAYTVDHSGYETYELHIIDNVETGSHAKDVLTGIDGDVLWGNDDSTLFYSVMDEEHRPYKLYMHVLGTDQSEDICLYTEDDGMFWMGTYKTADDAYLVLDTGGKETSECRVLSLKGLVGGEAHRNAAKQGMMCVQPRQFGVRYTVEHHEGTFYMLTNANGAKNNKLCRMPVSKLIHLLNGGTGVAWEDVRPYNPAQQLNRLAVFKNYIAIFGRSEGLQQLWIMNMQNNDAPWKTVKFPEIAYSLWCGANCVYDTSKLRLSYSSLVTPKQVLEYDMSTGVSATLKEQEVPKYDSSLYECRRVMAPSQDGRTLIPITLVYNKKLMEQRNNLARSSSGKSGTTSNGEDSLTTPPAFASPQPTLLYGYGSYGACIDPSFDFKRSAMLDRGVVYAIAHIRGGGEMGRAWYEDEGKYMTKLNTFTDFADCAKYLIAVGMTSADRLACVGRSAGGLLIGAVVNMYPELFKAAVADVPFVDVLNTMCDPTIPLTVTEWEEWGNPNERSYLNYMEQYSPYDNVRTQAYPAMLVTAGLNDPRVAYWEPAKWVAKLRELRTNTNPPLPSLLSSEAGSASLIDLQTSTPLLLKTDMSSGHFSASDRYKYLRESAFELSFILDQILPSKSETKK